MSKCTPPVIKERKASGESIKVTVYPDFAKFSNTTLSEEFLSIIERRAIDLAGCNVNLSVWYNGTKIHLSGKLLHIALTSVYLQYLR